MKARIHGLMGGSLTFRICAILIAVQAGLQGQIRERDAADAYLQGVTAESGLDMFGAREHLRRAIVSAPGKPGYKEHAAWFMYINGFHNAECLALFEQVLPHASDRRAMAQAMSHLREKLGLEPPLARPGIVRPNRPLQSTVLSRRLKYARELFWSGHADDAVAEFTKLIDLRPAEPALRWEIAKVLVSKGEFDQAVAHLREARRHRPNEPELVIDHAVAEALRGRRFAALQILDSVGGLDPGMGALARARAHHYSGEFFAAARQYEESMIHRPHDEIVAHGLAECRLRCNDIAGARELLAGWQGKAVETHWEDRVDLHRELTTTRLRAGAGYSSNSLDYERWEIGADLRFRPRDDVEMVLAATQGWFDQQGFSSIDRQTARMSARYQPDSFKAVHGFIGVNDYSNGWTSLVGGIGAVWRPVSTLELSVTVEHIDVVDTEPPLGLMLYSMGNTIGAVGGRATLDAVTFTSIWTPVENLDLIARGRLGELTGGNRLVDAQFDVVYTLSRVPSLRLGYALGFIDVEDPAPVYTEGANTTPLYYDPDNKVTHHLYAEYAGSLNDRVSCGADARLIFNQDGGIGFGAGGFIRYRWDDHHAARIEARFFTQDRSRDRNNTRTGSYDAFNLNAVYEYRF